MCRMNLWQFCRRLFSQTRATVVRVGWWKFFVVGLAGALGLAGVVWLTVWLVVRLLAQGTTGAERAAVYALVPAVATLIVAFFTLLIAALAWRRPVSALPKPAEFDVVQVTGGEIDDETGIYGLTRLEVAREVWGDPDPRTEPFSLDRRWSKAAENLAQSDAAVAHNLATARNLVPDYPHRSWLSPFRVSQRDWWVGITEVTIQLNVRVDNVGDLPGGIALRRSPESLELRPAALVAVGGWVQYTVHTVDDTRHEVAGRSSVRIPATVTLYVDCDPESWSTARDRGIGRARLGRAFAEFLRNPIIGVMIDAITDDKALHSHSLSVQVEDPAKRFAINALDVDQLEASLQAIDDAIPDDDPNRVLQ